MTREHLQEIFTSFGTIKAIEFHQDKVHPHLGKGFAYIEFTNADEAEVAMKHMDGGQIDGQEITAAPVLNVPRPQPMMGFGGGGRMGRRSPPPHNRRRGWSPPQRRSPFRGGGGGRFGGGGGGGGGGYGRRSPPPRQRRVSPPRRRRYEARSSSSSSR